MDQNTIALRLETPITRRYLDYIFTRKRRPSADLAKDLEQATGVDRRSWLYPDEFPNPYLASRPEAHMESAEGGCSKSTEQQEQQEAKREVFMHRYRDDPQPGDPGRVCSEVR